MERILHIAFFNNNIGGIETCIMNLYNAIDKEKYQFDFISSASESIYTKKIESMGGNLYFFPSAIKHPIKYYHKLKNLKDMNNYKIIHIHKNSLCNSWPIFIAKYCDFEHIIIHSHNTSSTGRFKKLKNKIHSLQKKIVNNVQIHRIACSKVAAEWMFGKKTDVLILNNGIDIQKFHFDVKKRIKIRKELGIQDNEYILGHVGRFMKEKNHIFMIRLMKELVKIDNSYKMFFVGDGELKGKYVELVRWYGLENNILFLGNRQDIDMIYQAMDCFVLPSLHEGLPLVGVEAQISGLQCLFSNNISSELLLTDNAKMLGVEDDLLDWVSLIQSFRQNNFDREPYAKIILEKGYSIENSAKKLEKFYKEINI